MEQAMTRLVRCWHEQAATLAATVERSGGTRGWDEAVDAFADASRSLHSRELRVAVNRAARSGWRRP